MKGVKVRITELKDYLLITVGSFIRQYQSMFLWFPTKLRPEV